MECNLIPVCFYLACDMSVVDLFHTKQTGVKEIIIMKATSYGQIKTFGITGYILLSAMGGELYAKDLTEEQKLGQRLTATQTSP